MTKYDLMRVSSDFKRLCCERFRKESNGRLNCLHDCPLRKDKKELVKTPVGTKYDVSTGLEIVRYEDDERDVFHCVFDDGDKAVLAIAEEAAE